MKIKKSALIIAVTTLLLAFLIIMIIILYDNKKITVQKNTYPIGISSMVYFQNFATSVCEDGDFIYISTLWGDTYEYDKKKDKIIEIPKIDDGTHYTCMNSINNKLYAISSVFMDSGSDVKVINKNFNNEDFEELFQLDKTKITGNISVSENNIFFYAEGDASFNENKNETYKLSLYMFDLNTGRKTLLTDNMHNYYIQNNRIYFSRYNMNKNTMSLFYIDFDNINKVIDTGILVNSDVNSYYYMFLPVDNKIYYSNATNTLYCTDLDNNKTEPIYTGADNEIIYFYNIFNDDMLIQSKVHINDYYFDYLYRVNLKTNEKKDLISYEDKSQVAGFIVFDNKKDNDNFIVIRSKDDANGPGTNYDYWIYNKDFKSKLIFSDLKEGINSN